MKTRLDHQHGQYRSQLFEELVFHLLGAAFPNKDLRHNVLIPKRARDRRLVKVPLDFALFEPSGEATVVETKAPYGSPTSHGVNRAIRRLKDLVPRASTEVPVKRAIFVLADKLPKESNEVYEKAAAYFRKKEVDFSIWDAAHVSYLCRELLGFQLRGFSIPELERALAKVGSSAAPSLEVRRPKRRGPAEAAKVGDRHEPLFIPPDTIRSGAYENVIVVDADFCSYSRFVAASGTDRTLVVSVMGRFYREAQQIVVRYGAILEKFTGDGLLFYWIQKEPNEDGIRIVESCVSELVGMSCKLAEEWQDRIDTFVRAKGMHCGAAIGGVLLIGLSPNGEPPHYAVGDCINLAARLCAKARPNRFLISNRLRSLLRASDLGFCEQKELRLKNMGEVLAWEKCYAETH